MKILIIGASILQLPAIKSAKKRGYTVGVVDYNHEAVGIPFADFYFNCSTNDKDGILKVAHEFKPNGIMTMATDMPMRSIAYVCSKVRLNSISERTALVCTDKIEMIKELKQNNIETPWFFEASSFEEFISLAQEASLPFIIKPSDSSGSRGVVLVESLDNAEKDFDYAVSCSKNSKVIVEEYLSGPEVSVEVFVVDKTPHILAITDKLTTGAPHFVEMGHSQPSMLRADFQDEIKSLAARAVLALGIDNGPAHAEIIVTKDGAKIVEVGARMGGDCITSHLVPLSTGISMVDLTINYSLNIANNIPVAENHASAIRYFKCPEGIIKKIEKKEGIDLIDGVKEIQLFASEGNKIGDITSSSTRVGYVIAQNKTAKDAIDTCERVLNSVKFIME